jgi:hypothetical protein
MAVPVTTVDLPEGLVEQAKSATGEKTAKGAIIAALTDTVSRQRSHDALIALSSHSHLADLLDPVVAAQAAR